MLSPEEVSETDRNSDKKNSIDENQVYGYDRNFKHIQQKSKIGVKRNDLFLEDPRVQVQEETGSQRVQVSNGYQEPFNLDNSDGRAPSGQVLEWGLIFYGTGADDEES